MNKIAFVVQRYGEKINGGAEYHCRTLAEHLLKYYSVDVLTSTAMSYTPWDDYFDAGEEYINGVHVIRFKVERIRSNTKIRALDERIRRGDESAEAEWFEEVGPFCPSCTDFLRNHWSEYKAIIMFTYSYYMTVAGLKLHLPNAILLPTAHDEPYLYFPVYQRVFNLPKAFFYNSIEEMNLINKIFHVEEKKHLLTCTGIDIPQDKNLLPTERLSEYGNNYILYIGRVSYGKNYKELNRFFIEYKKRNPETNIKLLVAGKIDDEMELINCDDIEYLGFISDDERHRLMANAKALVLPSMMESLSLVILESMAVKTPILVNGNCDVLKGQCIRSNAGLYYTNYFEFEKALKYILSNDDACHEMGENGFLFVNQNYSWKTVINNIHSFIEGNF